MSTNSSSPNISHTTSVTESVLFNVNYGAVSILVIWLYEYAITFDDEITFLRNSKWSIVKILYLVCRYLMFPFVITSTFHSLQQKLAMKECRSYFQFSLFAGAIIIVCAELMFLVRTYALWCRSRTALTIIIVNFTVFLIPTTVILALFDSAITVIPVSGITSCVEVPHNHMIVWAYVFLVIGETEILLSTVYQAVRYCREVGGRNRLLAVLVHHNSFYFCCSLASSVIMVSTMYFIPDPYTGVLADLQAIIHGILVTRMHRSLWNSDRMKENPSNPNDVSLPTMYFRSLPETE
ncbi:hypothetical protein BDN67DRAFT_1072519 [Paxillus ammoniavirescens]|nr:hypothetical protein BDN67DRAFT_1072519 [Paxillus ammoniavirescens]